MVNENPFFLLLPVDGGLVPKLKLPIEELMLKFDTFGSIGVFGDVGFGERWLMLEENDVGCPNVKVSFASPSNIGFVFEKGSIFKVEFCFEKFDAGFNSLSFELILEMESSGT